MWLWLLLSCAGSPATPTPGSRAERLLAQVAQVESRAATLAERAEADGRLREARLAERDATEQVALLLAEEVEVENALYELRLRERDEERRLELMADSSADAAVTAQRAYENACLQFFTEYVEQATALLHRG